MALISRDLGLLFIMAPHTGCTAVGTLLNERFGAMYLPEQDIPATDGRPAIPRKHTTLPQLREAGLIEQAFPDPDARSRLVIASTIRNPFDMNVSAWYRWYRKLDPEHPLHNPEFESRAGGDGGVPPSELPAARADFERWLVHRYQPSLSQRLRGRFRRVQAFRWTEGSDVVLRHERLQEDLDALLTRLGVEGHHEIPTVNVTRKRDRRPYQEWYTPRSRRIVEGAFADDLAEFGYRFEDGAVGQD
jgi:hypothetical protein